MKAPANPSRCRGILRPLILCLTLGLATTLAVAWTLAVQTHPDIKAAVFHEDPGRWWFLRTTSAYGGAVRYIWIHPVAAGAQLRGAIDQGPDPRILGSWQRLMDLHQSLWFYSAAQSTNSRSNPIHSPVPAPINAITGSAWAAVLDERGWPLPALRSRISLTTDLSTAPTYTYSWGRALPPLTTSARPGLSGTIADQRVFPMMPAWPGFAVDTLLYAGAYALIFTAARSIAARLRRKPGTCPKCGYELSGLTPGAPCPECGLASA